MKKLYYLFALALMTGINLDAQTYVKIDAAGLNDGSSWENAYNNLNDAISNTSSGEIWVATGTYRPQNAMSDSSATFFIDKPISLYGGFEGYESNLNQRDWLNYKTILSGDINDDDVDDDFENNKSDNVQHVIRIDSFIGNDITISGFEITGGHSSDNGDLDSEFTNGAGILSYNTLHVEHCSFYQNFARGGAGIYVLGYDLGGQGSSVNDCQFYSNSATAQSAGILYEGIVDGAIENCSFSNNQTARGALYPLRCVNLTIDSCAFNSNVAITNDGFGGAMFVWAALGLNMSYCSFTNNRAGNGAVMYYDGREITPDLLEQFPNNITNCFFSNNQAVDWGGGCIYNWRGSYNMSSCTFSANSATNGSCIYNGGEIKNIEIRNSLFQNGSGADFGGAMLCYGSESNYLIDNCDFEFNQAAISGGSMIAGFEADVTISNSTFVENQAQWGGAMYVQNSFTDIYIDNSRYEGNMASNNGGAINYAGAGEFYIDKCEFLGNIGGIGGALNVTESLDTTELAFFSLSNSILDFNESTTQGAGLNINETEAVLTNNQFAYNLNTDGVAGGAISINVGDSISRSATFINNTLANNFANIGSGIATYEGLLDGELELTMQNNILYNPGGKDYEVEDGTPTVISMGGNVSRDDSTIGVLNNDLDQSQVTDPGFINPQSDFHLSSTSPIIDQGVSNGAPEFDLEGLPRINETDPGAYEYQTSNTQETLVDPKGVLDIFPNPVQAFTNVKLENNWRGQVEIKIVDIQGKVISNYFLAKNIDLLEKRLDLHYLNSGIYELLISDGDEMIVKSLIKN